MTYIHHASRDHRRRLDATEATAPNGLLNDLIAYWPGDEANGNLVDAHTNGLDLTDAYTVTSASGLVYATARQYTKANYEHHKRATEALLEMGDIDFTIAQWVNLDSVYTAAAGALTLIDKYDGNGWVLNQIGYGIGKFSFSIYAGAASKGTIRSNTFGTPSINTWYLVISAHSATDNTVNIQVNNGTIDSAATTAAAVVSSADLGIGARVGVGFFMNGRIGPSIIWKSALTADQRTALYNAGAGLTYAQFTA